jgi:REP element-mobilizing transposase RayT
MPKNRVSIDQNQGVYFVTPTVWNWYYLSGRHHRWEILADSLRYCQQHKGLGIFAYVFMLNHVHLIVQSPNMAGFLRDFKRYTAQALLENIQRTEPNILPLFTHEDGSHRIWKEDNQPKPIETEDFGLQKMRYIHHNPVVKGYVDRPEYWRWSSANPDSPIVVQPVW